MSNNKQSSVELFIEQLEEKGKAYEETIGCRTVNICIDVSDYMELKQQVKEMHKEETLKLYNEYEDYLDYEFKNQLGGQSVIKSFEQYYNETFGGNNEQQ